MRKYSRSFFSIKKAEAFAAILKKQNADGVVIWSGLDAFNQTVYVVRWN